MLKNCILIINHDFRLASKMYFLTARVFTVFGHSFLEDRMLYKEAWVTTLLGTHLSIQVHKKVRFSRRDISSLAVKGLDFIRLTCRNGLWEFVIMTNYFSLFRSLQ